MGKEQLRACRTFEASGSLVFPVIQNSNGENTLSDVFNVQQVNSFQWHECQQMMQH